MLPKQPMNTIKKLNTNDATSKKYIIILFLDLFFMSTCPINIISIVQSPKAIAERKIAWDMGYIPSSSTGRRLKSCISPIGYIRENITPITNGQKQNSIVRPMALKFLDIKNNNRVEMVNRKNIGFKSSNSVAK